MEKLPPAFEAPTARTGPRLGIAPLSEPAFQRFAEHIGREFGIRIAENKRAMLEARLMKRVRHLDLKDLDAYHDFFFSPEGLHEKATFLANVITTNKSDFFREPQHFHFLRERILPAFFRDVLPREQRPFAVWSAGCASGEEPYTIAMVLSEFARANPPFRFTVLGTDVSQNALDEAFRGVYAAAKTAPIPQDMRRHYLSRSRDAARSLVRVVPELRSRIRFAKLNFMEPVYPVRERFDVIFFRNVMIYFDPETQAAVVNRLCRHLRSGGYFLPGHTESLSSMTVPLESAGTAIYRKA